MFMLRWSQLQTQRTGDRISVLLALYSTDTINWCIGCGWMPSKRFLRYKMTNLLDISITVQMIPTNRILWKQKTQPGFQTTLSPECLLFLLPKRWSQVTTCNTNRPYTVQRSLDGFNSSKIITTYPSKESPVFNERIISKIRVLILAWTVFFSFNSEHTNMTSAILLNCSDFIPLLDVLRTQH